MAQHSVTTGPCDFTAQHSHSGALYHHGFAKCQSGSSDLRAKHKITVGHCNIVPKDQVTVWMCNITAMHSHGVELYHHGPAQPHSRAFGHHNATESQ